MEKKAEQKRIVGIRHRVKQTTEGESSPTQVAILKAGEMTCINLETEDDELDFLLDRHPAYDGLQAGDTVAMVLGGSGDRFAAALSRRGEEIGARVLRIPSFVLKEKRNGVPKEDDHKTLASLAQDSPELFYPVEPRDRATIQVTEAFRARQDAVNARIACQQRLLQRVIGQVFLNEEGRYPEGTIEDACDRQKASDVILKALLEEEKGRENELKKAVHKLGIWGELFSGIEGCGERIAAGIITAVADIRRFETPAQLKAFCGVHVLPDGRLPRKRSGQVANWNPLARQSLYLLGNQFNRRPESTWGKKLLDNKAKFRQTHPEPIKSEEGKWRYNDGHIHNMAIWRTLTQFVVWLHREWWNIERSQ